MKHAFLRLIAVCFLPLAPSVLAQTPSKEAVELLRNLKTIPPIQIPAGARTEMDVERELAVWSERVILKPARERIAARKDAPWAAGADLFLKDAAQIVFSFRALPAPKELHEAGEKLIGAKCDEPAVALFAGLVGMRAGADWRYIFDCASVASKGFDAAGAPAVLSFHTQNLLGWAREKSGRTKERDEAEAKVMAMLELMSSDGSFAAGEEELFLHHFWGAGKALERNADKLVALAPKLKQPEWVQLSIVGYGEIKLAWKSRGGEWAGKVADDGWKGFELHLGKAREALVKAWKANPKSPMAAAEMITVTMGGVPTPGETERTWFDRAVAARCDYRQAYDALMWAYRPRWSGSHEQMLGFGKACMNTKRYDTDIPSYFTRACNAIVFEIGNWREFYRQPEVARPLMELSEAWLNEPTRTQEKNMRQSYLAVNAWLTGDYTKAAAALKSLGGPLHEDTLLKLSSHRVTEQDFREEVALGVSPVAADFAKAEALFKEGKNAEAAEAFRKLQPRAPGEAGELVAARLRVMDLEKQLAKGEWTKLPTTPGLNDWLQRGGNWSATADGTLINKGADFRGAIVHRARVGKNFEMRLEFSVESKAKCCRRCDIIFGWHEGFQEPMNMAVFGQPGQFPAEAKFDCTYQRPSGAVKKGINYQDNNTLLLRSSGGKLTFTVNGQPAFTEHEPAGMDLGPDDSRVGVGSTRWCKLNITSIRNIEVRKLP